MGMLPMMDLWGGAVWSPCMADHDCLACKHKSSWLNVLKLAFDPYPVGYDGVRRLTEKIIFNCSLTKATGHINDASICFQDVFQAHKKVYDGWYNPRCITSSPNVDNVYCQKNPVTLPSTKYHHNGGNCKVL
jgi:hypothetical protein